MVKSRDVLPAQLLEKSGLVDRDGGHGGGLRILMLISKIPRIVEQYPRRRLRQYIAKARTRMQEGVIGAQSNG